NEAAMRLSGLTLCVNPGIVYPTRKGQRVNRPPYNPDLRKRNAKPRDRYSPIRQYDATRPVVMIHHLRENIRKDRAPACQRKTGGRLSRDRRTNGGQRTGSKAAFTVGPSAFVTEEWGIMRGKTFRAAWLSALLLAVMPLAVMGQTSTGDATGYAPADPQLPIPLGSTRPEDGGFFTWAEYTMFRQTNPLGNQTIAVRGFYVWDSSIPGFNNGNFIGSRTEALNVNYLTSQEFYQPGFDLGVGWKFKDGSALTLDFLYLASNNFRAAATLAARNGRVGVDF